MADDTDRSNDQQQNLVDAAIKKITLNPLNHNNTSGHCWSCGQMTGKQKRWCNAQCRDEWEQG